MPEAKPVSLHPFKFDETIKAIVSVDRVGLIPMSKLLPRKRRVR